MLLRRHDSHKIGDADVKSRLTWTWLDDIAVTSHTSPERDWWCCCQVTRLTHDWMMLLWRHASPMIGWCCCDVTPHLNVIRWCSCDVTPPLNMIGWWWCDVTPHLNMIGWCCWDRSEDGGHPGQDQLADLLAGLEAVVSWVVGHISWHQRSEPRQNIK